MYSSDMVTLPPSVINMRYHSSLVVVASSRVVACCTAVVRLVINESDQGMTIIFGSDVMSYKY